MENTDEVSGSTEKKGKIRTDRSTMNFSLTYVAEAAFYEYPDEFPNFMISFLVTFLLIWYIFDSSKIALFCHFVTSCHDQSLLSSRSCLGISGSFGRIASMEGQ